MSEETKPPTTQGVVTAEDKGRCAPATGSAKWVVRDLTRRLPDQECDTNEQADKWVAHLWEWQPSARPVVISPNASDQRPGPR